MNVRPNVFALSGGPLTQALSVLVFAVLLVGAVVMGAVLLAAIVGVAAIAWLVFSIRFWWLGRKLGRRAAAHRDQMHGDPMQRNPAQRDPTQPAGRLIEAEYTVLDERDPRRSPRDGEPK